ncbi:MAG TPA: alpha/beta hydrolase fold domain-containing protein, partial [Methanocorpusculum sp.]|nr:alpha/beta hydrolase fold domain-containing protein [Methanocorpusculum sp.]
REVYLWIRRHATDYGGDDRGIYAPGDSAGGNLAIVLALQERLCGLMLFYPVTTVVPGRYGESWEEFACGYALDAKLMEAFTEAYVPEILRDNPHVSPLESADLSRLPQTLCITAECDILRDQGRRFCDLLRKAGVSVTERCFPGAVHLFVTVTGMDGDFRKGVFECTAFLQE